MSYDIECSVSVAKVSDVHTDERDITVILKGQKTVTHDLNGYDIEDPAYVEVKVKCGMMKTAEILGISEFLATKIFTMRDRDMSLQNFGHEVEQEQIA